MPNKDTKNEQDDNTKQETSELKETDNQVKPVVSENMDEHEKPEDISQNKTAHDVTQESKPKADVTAPEVKPYEDTTPKRTPNVTSEAKPDTAQFKPDVTAQDKPDVTSETNPVVKPGPSDVTHDPSIASSHAQKRQQENGHEQHVDTHTAQQKPRPDAALKRVTFDVIKRCLGGSGASAVLLPVALYIASFAFNVLGYLIYALGSVVCGIGSFVCVLGSIIGANITFTLTAGVGAVIGFVLFSFKRFTDVLNTAKHYYRLVQDLMHNVKQNNKENQKHTD